MKARDALLLILLALLCGLEYQSGSLDAVLPSPADTSDAFEAETEFDGEEVEALGGALSTHVDWVASFSARSLLPVNAATNPRLPALSACIPSRAPPAIESTKQSA